MIRRLSAMAGFCIFTVLVVILAGSAMAQTVRPYQFGFTIEEQQHRSEKRDERGIVMGEFGFITADGIYHVTVYATDEEGRFRILAMRNYPYKSPPKTIDMVVVAKKKPPPAVTTAAPSLKPSLPKYNFQNEGCAGCFLTKTRSKPDGEETNAIAPNKPNPKTDIRPLSKQLETNAPSNVLPGAKPAAKGYSGQPAAKAFINTNQSPPKTQTTNLVKAPTLTKANKPSPQPTRFIAPTGPLAIDPRILGDEDVKPQTVARTPTVAVEAFGKSAAGGAVSKIANPTKNYSKGSTASSNNGPAGVAAKAGSGGAGDLYHFKYTLDFNGHEETGSRNGNKVGSYFAIGDDNVERTIEYVANENGYQPRIRWRKLDAQEADLLRALQENTLKDYEFVWFKEQ